MATIRQSASGGMTGADPDTATFASSPVQGNLLLAIASERSGGDASNHTLTGITGWTHEIIQTTEQANSTYRRTFSVFYKEAGASESTGVTLDDGTANDKYLSIYEYEHGVGEDQWTLLDSVSADNGQTIGGTTQTTGTTASVSGTMLLFAGLLAKRGASSSDISVTWDNDVDLEDAEFNPGASQDMSHAAGSTSADTVTGTKESTGTLGASANNRGLDAGMLVFDIVSTGGSSIPVFMHHYTKNMG